jgi:outer membrane biosynthesis protein TonB
MTPDNNEKQQAPQTTQDIQAPQDENPMTAPRQSPKNKKSEKTANHEDKHVRGRHV